MSLHIGILYHWSPSENRKSILRDGLKVLQPDVTGLDFNAPYICLATTPSSAWSLCGCDDTDIREWDMWQVVIQDGDDLTIRGDFSPFIREVRIHNSVPADRVWFVGERENRL